MKHQGWMDNMKVEALLLQANYMKSEYINHSKRQ